MSWILILVTSPHHCIQGCPDNFFVCFTSRFTVLILMLIIVMWECEMMLWWLASGCVFCTFTCKMPTRSSISHQFNWFLTLWCNMMQYMLCHYYRTCQYISSPSTFDNVMTWQNSAVFVFLTKSAHVVQLLHLFFSLVFCTIYS